MFEIDLKEHNAHICIKKKKFKNRETDAQSLIIFSCMFDVNYLKYFRLS